MIAFPVNVLEKNHKIHQTFTTQHTKRVVRWEDLFCASTACIYTYTPFIIHYYTVLYILMGQCGCKQEESNIVSSHLKHSLIQSRLGCNASISDFYAIKGRLGLGT